MKDLQKGYQELELKGAQEQDHLLFELGRLGEQMVEKNQEFGALMEKLSLTSRALQVAEEKIEHLEAVDKQRNHHFKELQHQCAQHEKEQREVSHIHIHGLRTPNEEIAFTARQIKFKSQIFRYGLNISCLPKRPKISDFFNLCLYWVSVVRDHIYKVQIGKILNLQQI